MNQNFNVFSANSFGSAIFHWIFAISTVDGSEIRRSPVEVGSLSPLFIGFD